MLPNEIRSGTPSVVRMLIGRSQTLPVFCCPTQGVCQTACGGKSQALRRECTVAGGDCRAAGEAQGCRPERSLPVWQRQKVQEVLPPLKGSPAAPTGPAVRKAPHKLAQSAASQILLATLTLFPSDPSGGRQSSQDR